jgi:trans-2,3-dihydro-3-hydroxyanthranilate isomerase
MTQPVVASSAVARYAFSILDVFSARRFGGNQLAVLPDARGLTSAAMQQIAREFNFAETAFVLPPADPGHTRQVRIFTPRAEMPFAGHPTIGTACELVRGGHVVGPQSSPQSSPRSRPTALILEEDVGPVGALVTAIGGAFSAEFTLSTELARPAGAPSPEALAEVLSLAPDQVLASWFAGIGVNFTFAEVAHPETVDAAVLDQSAWARHLSGTWGPQVFLFAHAPTNSGPTRIYARMFAPALGIPEDPATGSAAGALAAVLAQQAAHGRPRAIRIEQGVALGRPSEIRAHAVTQASGRTIVTVGGACTHVADGHLDLEMPPPTAGGPADGQPQLRSGRA